MGDLRSAVGKKALLAGILCFALVFAPGCSGSTGESSAEAGGASAASGSSEGASAAADSDSAEQQSSSEGLQDAQSADVPRSGTPEAALLASTEAGITKMSGADLQDLMNVSLTLGMTLETVRGRMGCAGTELGSDYPSFTYAFYATDISKVILCTFDGQEPSSVLTKTEISIVS